MKRPAHINQHELGYFESRLSALLETLRSRRSVYALAATCDAIEAALADEPVYSTARNTSRTARYQITARDLEETAQRLFGAQAVNPETLQ